MTDLLVVGGGVAGLVSAWTAVEAGRTVTLIEAEDHLGGAVTGHVLNGLEMDAGTESFATRGGGVEPLLHRLGLGDRIIAPNPAGAWVGYRQNDDFAASRLPRTGMLGIPGDLDADDLVEAIGIDAVRVARRDRALPADVGVCAASREAAGAGHVTTLGQLVEARMGRAVVDRLVAPVAGGIYSGDPYGMPVDAVAPGLLTALAECGTLSGAVRMLQAQRAPGSAVRGLSGGMHVLTDRLRDRIFEGNGRILMRHRVDRLARDAEGWHARVSGTGALADWLDADQLVLATTADPALHMLADLSPNRGRRAGDGRVWAGRSWATPAAVSLVTVIVDDDRLDDEPRGTGMLVAADAPQVQAKAMTHASAKWGWIAEAARAQSPTRHVLRLSYGRAGQLDDLSDGRLRAQAVHDARVMTGVDFEADAVTGVAVHHWHNVQPSPHAVEIHRAVDACVEELDDLAVIGSWRSGTGLASVMPHAREHTERLLAVRSDQSGGSTVHRTDIGGEGDVCREEVCREEVAL